MLGLVKDLFQRSFGYKGTIREQLNSRSLDIFRPHVVPAEKKIYCKVSVPELHFCTVYYSEIKIIGIATWNLRQVIKMCVQLDNVQSYPPWEM